MINIKCPNKNQGFCGAFLQKCWPEKLHQKFSAFFNHFFFLKQIEKLGWKVFQKLSTPIFFICLYFIGVGGDENLKHYLAWPKLSVIFKHNPSFKILDKFAQKHVFLINGMLYTWVSEDGIFLY